VCLFTRTHSTALKRITQWFWSSWTEMPSTQVYGNFEPFIKKNPIPSYSHVTFPLSIVPFQNYAVSILFWQIPMGKWESRIPIPDDPLFLLSLRYKAGAIPDRRLPPIDRRVTPTGLFFGDRHTCKVEHNKTQLPHHISYQSFI